METWSIYEKARKVNSRTRLGAKSNLESPFVRRRSSTDERKTDDGYESAESAYKNSGSVSPPAIAFHQSLCWGNAPENIPETQSLFAFVRSASREKNCSGKYRTGRDRFMIINDDTHVILVRSHARNSEIPHQHMRKTWFEKYSQPQISNRAL